MVTIPVPYGLDVSVSFRRENDMIFVDVHAPLYMVKQWTMSHRYADSFTDRQILRDPDFQTVLINHYDTE